MADPILLLKLRAYVEDLSAEENLISVICTTKKTKMFYFSSKYVGCAIDM